MDAASLERMRIALKSQGLSEAEINERLEQWQTEETAWPEFFTGTIEDAHFEWSDEFESAQFACDIRVHEIYEPSDMKVPDRPIKGWWSCGKDWQLLDSAIHPVTGKLVGNEVSGRKTFRSNSKYGKLIDRVALELDVPIYLAGLPTYAPVWDDLFFEWKRERQEMPERLRREGGRDSIETVLPTKWLQDTMPGVTSVGAPTEEPKTRSVPAKAVKTPTKTGAGNNTVWQNEEEKASILAFIDVAVGKEAKEARLAALRDQRVTASDSIMQIIVDTNGYTSFLDLLKAHDLISIGEDWRIWRVEAEANA